MCRGMPQTPQKQAPKTGAAACFSRWCWITTAGAQWFLSPHPVVGSPKTQAKLSDMCGSRPTGACPPSPRDALDRLTPVGGGPHPPPEPPFPPPLPGPSQPHFGVRHHRDPGLTLHFKNRFFIRSSPKPIRPESIPGPTGNILSLMPNQVRPPLLPPPPAPAMPHKEPFPSPFSPEGGHHHIRRGKCATGPPCVTLQSAGFERQRPAYSPSA